MNKTKNSILLTVSLMCFAIAAIAWLIAFFIEADPVNPQSPSLIGFVGGILFYGFTVLGIVLQTALSIGVRRWYNRRRVYRIKYKRPGVGLCRFFSNVPAAISDGMLFAAVICSTVFCLVGSDGFVVYLSFSVLFLSFCTHCIFNGKNYYYMTHYERINAQLSKMEEK